MTNVQFIKTVRTELIGPDEELATLKTEIDLYIQEVKRSQKALQEAQGRMDFLISKKFQEKGLKFLEGEAIQVPEYDVMYFWACGQLRSLPTSVLRSMKHD